MLAKLHLRSSLLMVLLSSAACAQVLDNSPHTIQFISVDKDVRLEVLDWGGSGLPPVLLAGLGNNAHIFDSFAPKLTHRTTSTALPVVDLAPLPLLLPDIPQTGLETTFSRCSMH